MTGLSSASLQRGQRDPGATDLSGSDVAGESDAARAARQMESFFLRQLLAEVRPEGGMLDGGFAGSTFHEMLDGVLADSMAEAGGVGLAEMIEPELERAAGGSPGHAARLPADVERSASSLPTARSRALTAYRATAGSLAADDPGMPAPVLKAAPVIGQPSSSFGRRTDPIDGDVRTHAGMDIAAPEGAPVRAAGDGVVVRSERAGGYGNLVVIDHGSGLQTRYGHLSRIDVKAGQRVDAGAPLGAVGHTGRATGSHLHFEVRRDGRAVDPGLASLPGLVPATTDPVSEEKSATPINSPEKWPNRQGGGR